MFVRLVYVLHVTWFVNSATHIWGYRNYETTDDSRNLWWVGLLAFGEGWHNNHHAYQRMARAGPQVVGNRHDLLGHPGAGEAGPGLERGQGSPQAPEAGLAAGRVTGAGKLYRSRRSKRPWRARRWSLSVHGEVTGRFRIPRDRDGLSSAARGSQFPRATQPALLRRPLKPPPLTGTMRPASPRDSRSVGSVLESVRCANKQLGRPSVYRS